MNTFEKIYEIVKTLPKGKVATYGQAAFFQGMLGGQELSDMLCITTQTQQQFRATEW